MSCDHLLFWPNTRDNIDMETLTYYLNTDHLNGIQHYIIWQFCKGIGHGNVLYYIIISFIFFTISCLKEKHVALTYLDAEKFTYIQDTLLSRTTHITDK